MYHSSVIICRLENTSSVIEERKFPSKEEGMFAPWKKLYSCGNKEECNSTGTGWKESTVPKPPFVCKNLHSLVKVEPQVSFSSFSLNICISTMNSCYLPPTAGPSLNSCTPFFSNEHQCKYHLLQETFTDSG
jgi:hypothetical protein